MGHVDVISFHDEDFVSNIENCDVINAKQFIEKITEEEETKTFRGKAWLDMIFRPNNPYSYFSKDHRKELFFDQYCKTNDYDFIVCRYIGNAIAYGLLKYSDKLIIDVDDNPKSVCKVRSGSYSFSSTLKRLKNSLRGRLIGGATLKLLNNTCCSFYSNPLDPPSPKSVLLYNTTNIKARTQITNPDNQRLLFVGDLNYPPNKTGIKHFVERVFPIVRKTFPSSELHIVGKTYDQPFIDYLNSIESVSALGFVEDVIEEYDNARVVIIPIYHGSGTSVKFVEGIMMNRPVVSTPMGVRGFENICKDGEHYLLARDDKEFADRIIELLSSVDKSRQLAHNALQAGNEYFSQQGFMKIVKDTIVGLDKR